MELVPLQTVLLQLLGSCEPWQLMRLLCACSANCVVCLAKMDADGEDAPPGWGRAGSPLVGLVCMVWQ